MEGWEGERRGVGWRGGGGVLCRSASTALSLGVCAEPAWVGCPPRGSAADSPGYFGKAKYSSTLRPSPALMVGGGRGGETRCDGCVPPCGTTPESRPLLPGGFVLPEVKIAHFWGGGGRGGGSCWVSSAHPRWGPWVCPWHALCRALQGAMQGDAHGQVGLRDWTPQDGGPWGVSGHPLSSQNSDAAVVRACPALPQALSFGQGL